MQVLYMNGGDFPNAQQDLWRESLLGGDEEAIDRFGSQLAANDFNGDGAAELAVGVPSDSYTVDGEFFEASGSVYVIRGADGGLTATGSDFFFPGQAHYFGEAGNVLFYGAVLSR